MSEEDAIARVKPIDQQLLDACIHCGMCLPACPTYLATGREVESPRGRIALLSAWQSGAQEFSPRLAEHIDSCLGCLGCQTACPSGVEYEKILNASRPQLAQKRPFVQRAFMRFSFDSILPNYLLLRFLGFCIILWQKLKLRAVLQFLAEHLPFLKSIALCESYVPHVPPFHPLPRQSGIAPGKSGPIQFFAGCVMDIFYNHVNHAALRLLLRQEHSVSVPKQTCCGALAFHAGETDIAIALAKRNISDFANSTGEIVVTSAGCGAMLKEYPSLFEKDDSWRERAKHFSKRVKDISETLAQGQFVKEGPATTNPTVTKVAYHAACHLAHAQNVRTEPAKLLQDVVERNGSPKIELVPLHEAEHCCGSAGIYNLIHPDLADDVLDRKLENIQKTGADLVVTSNPGCLLQLQRGIERKGLPVKVEHLAEFLDKMY